MTTICSSAVLFAVPVPVFVSVLVLGWLGSVSLDVVGCELEKSQVGNGPGNQSKYLPTRSQVPILRVVSRRSSIESLLLK